jgi:nicotinamide-nucleotide amidase
MSDPNLAEIISVGTELLRGEITDTNSGYLASQLPLLGVRVNRMCAVGDDVGDLRQVLDQALQRSGLVITSGGLGPTEDDLTRDAIAGVMGEEMVVDPGLESQLRAMFSRMGREMPPHNLRQALLIPSAMPLPNARGTAPGWWVEKNGETVVALPGPPRELMPMWGSEVLPRLRAKLSAGAIQSRTIKTFVIAEAKVAELLQPFFDSGNPELGIYSKADGIHVRMIAHGDDAEAVLDRTEQRLVEVLEPHVWGHGDESLEGLICRWLHRRGVTLATIEDGTGGLLASTMTAGSGSEECYRGGLVARADGAMTFWGVPADLIEEHGAVSSEAAEAMAEAARERFDADFGLSTTAITGLDSADGRPPGLAFIGVADSSGTRSWQQNYPPSRGDARNRAAVAALFRLRERLMELGLDAP